MNSIKLTQKLRSLTGSPSLLSTLTSFRCGSKKVVVLGRSTRSFSTNLEHSAFVVKVGEETIAIPPNLQLADVQALKKPEKPVSKIVLGFPPLKIPETIEMKSWAPGGETRAIPLEKAVFGVGIRPDIVHELVCHIRNKQRQPKRTKRIGDISGSNKKPRPQKKTGTSQVGNKRNSAWRGGQKAHGPVLRSYETGMPKKARALGMMMTLAAKHREGNLHVFDRFAAETHKTKNIAEIMKEHGLDEKRTLVVERAVYDKNFQTGARNLWNIKLLTLLNLNAWEVLRAEKILFCENSFAAIQKKLVYQHREGGKKKSNARNLDAYAEMVQRGRKVEANHLKQQQEAKA